MQPITRDDIMPMEAYARERAARRQHMIAVKRARRLEVGPFATFYFENRETMLQQIHEMLWIEKGGAEQVEDELRAYNPLVPRGDELVATLMFEIPDPARRARVLAELGGVEDTISLQVGDQRITARPEVEEGIERTSRSGKTSSVHFLHFPFGPEQIARFRDPATRVVIAVEHASYAHMAVMPEAMRAQLAGDFD